MSRTTGAQGNTQTLEVLTSQQQRDPGFWVPSCVCLTETRGSPGVTRLGGGIEGQKRAWGLRILIIGDRTGEIWDSRS